MSTTNNKYKITINPAQVFDPAVVAAVAELLKGEKAEGAE